MLTDLNLEPANDTPQNGQRQRDRDLRETWVAVMADWNSIGNGGHDGLQVFHDNRVAGQDGPAVGATGCQIERRQCGSVDLFALGPGVNAPSLAAIGRKVNGWGRSMGSETNSRLLPVSSSQ